MATKSEHHRLAVDSVLRLVYYDPKSPASFAGRDKVFETIKEEYPWISIRDVNHWLKQQAVHQLYTIRPQPKNTEHIKADYPGQKMMIS